MNKYEKKKRLLLLGSMITLMTTACVKNDELEKDIERVVLEESEKSNTFIIANAKEVKKNKYAEVINDTKIYLGPSEKYDSVLNLKKGVNIEIKAKSADGWYMAEYKDKIGFINASCLNMNNTIIPDSYDVEYENSKDINYVEAKTDVNIR